jgi:hypothetical protein
MFDYEDAYDQLLHRDEAEPGPGWARRYPAPVREAIGMGALAWPLAVQRAIAHGVRDANQLTNIAFFMHFPELNGATVPADHPKIEAYRQTWSFLRAGVRGMLDAGPSAPAGGKTLDDHLRRITERVAAHKRCVLGKLLDPRASHQYLPARGVTAFLGTSALKHGIGAHQLFYLDMRKDLEKALARFRSVPTGETIESRLLGSFDRAYLELYDGIRALQFAECHDKRTPAMRRDIFALRKDSRSLYSCPAVKQVVEGLMEELAGFDRVKPEYGCAA